MAVHVFAKFAIAILAYQTVFTVVTAQSVVLFNQTALALNTTSPLEDYIEQNLRQYKAIIKSSEEEIAAIRASYQEQLNTINTQSNLVESKLLEVQLKLDPLELLDELSKHCVQKYRSQITTIATVRTTLASCVSSANSNLNGYLTAPENIVRWLTNYLNSPFQPNLNDCKKKHINSQANYTVCVTQVITTTNNYFIANQKSLATQLEVAKCSTSGRIKLAVDCGFTALYNTISKAAAATRLIDNCIAGLEICPPCNAAPSKKCDTPLYVAYTETELRNDTISNPFQKLDKNASCVEVNFIPETVDW